MMEKRREFRIWLYMATILYCFVLAQSFAFPRAQTTNQDENGDIELGQGTEAALSPEVDFANETVVPTLTNVSISTSTPISLAEIGTPTAVSSSTTESATPLPLPTVSTESLPENSSKIDSFGVFGFLPRTKESNLILLDEPGKNGSIEVDYMNTVESSSSTSSSGIFIPAPAAPVPSLDPSIQLVPPPLTGQLEASSTASPRNIKEISLSLVSLSGNSGGSEEGNLPDDHGKTKESDSQVDYTQYRYHVETGKLIKIGSTGAGICPPNMRFFAVPGHTKNGACDCDYYQCSRPLIYSLEKHQCFWAWSQGPCAEDEWFIFNHDVRRGGICQKNPCLDEIKGTDTINGYLPTPPPSYSSFVFQNPNDLKCYHAGSNGYCEDRDERLLIFPGEAPIPTCRKYTFCYPLTVPQELQCIYGSKYYLESGQCNR